MFKYVVMSIVVVPILLALKVARRHSGRQALSLLAIGWGVYSALWVAIIYYLKLRWLE